MSNDIFEEYSSKMLEPVILTSKKRRLSINFFQTKKTNNPKVHGRRLSNGIGFSNYKKKVVKLAPLNCNTPLKNMPRSQSACIIDHDVTLKNESNFRNFLTTPIRNIAAKFHNVAKSASKTSPKRTRSLPRNHNPRLAVNLKSSLSMTSLPMYAVVASDEITPMKITRSWNKQIKNNLEIIEKKQSSDETMALPKKRKSDYFLTLTSWRTEKNNPTINLKEYLKKKSRVLAFRTFLQKEFSEENLDFWVEIENYKNLKINKQKKIAPIIYDTYIKVGAQREINIDARTRQKTKENVVNSNNLTFSLAQERVLILMERDSYPRYLLKKTNLKSIINPHSLTNNKKLKTSSSCILKIDSKNYRKSVSNNSNMDFGSVFSINVTQRRKRKNSM